MVDYPQGFLADLRSPRPWPSFDSVWRAPYLVRHTLGHAWELIRGLLPPAPARVLDIGSGTGFLSLELARAGHEVVGLDTDQRAVAVATATLETDPLVRASVTYHDADVETWAAPQGSFDAVIVSRVLHHLRDPGATLAEVRRWLRPGGRLVCLDFAYDRFDRRSARWLASLESLLEAVGAYPAADPVVADPRTATDRVLDEWQRDHAEHDLRTWAEIRTALDRSFVEHHVSWHAYLYWEVLVNLRAPTPAVEERLAATIPRWERLWIEEAQMPSVLFAFAGTPRP